MSDNEDLLGDDLGDQSLADYNLGNEEEEQLLADDYENTAPQNVPSSIGPAFREPIDNMVPQPQEYRPHEYSNQPISYQPVVDTECVVPNITVEVPNVPVRDHSTYAPYEPPVYDEHAVPPAIPAAPVESPQIVPSDIIAPVPNGSLELSGANARVRFPQERGGAQRLPQVRDIPDTLDKVVIPRGGWGARGRTSWRAPHFQARFSHNAHPYRRNNIHRGNFNQRASFPPPQIRPNQIRPEVRPEIRPEIRPEVRPEVRPDIRPDVRPDIRPDIRSEMRPDIQPEMRPEIRPDIRPDMRPDLRPDLRPDMRPDMRPDIRPDMRPDMRPDIRPDMRPDMRPDIRPEIRPDLGPEIRPEIRVEPNIPPQMGPEISPERPILPQEIPMFRPPIERPPFFPRFQFRPNVEERPPFPPGPNYDPRFFRPSFPPRQFPPPMREIVPNASHMPQVTIRQTLPGMPGPNLEKIGPKVDLPREPEVRMLPVPLPANLPPGGLAGKKVLINPHFKGNFQPPVEGLPAYIPTRIQKSPPLTTTIESKFGPVKDIDDAAERFIAEQRNALARAAVRKQHARRSPQRYIENTTIEIENELAHTPYRRNDDDDLLRRQEEFINANRAGLRRRMRSPSPARRSPSPRRSAERERPERRARPDEPRHYDEDSEYKRRLREQESLRERVLRAKEVRRRKNAVALHKQLQDKEREILDKEKTEIKPEVPIENTDKPTSTEQENKPDTTRSSPEKEKLNPVPAEIVRDRSPVKEVAQVNSTVENLTPPHKVPFKQESPERDLTPPLPDKRDEKRTDSDDDLDLILGDIDGILSDDDDSGRFKEKPKKPEPTKSKPQVDLRSKLPPKTSTSSSDSKKTQRQKIVFTEDKEEKKKKEKSPPRRAVVTSSTRTEDTENIESKKLKTKSKVDNITIKSRQRITYDNKEPEKESDDKKSSFSNRRVILQRKTAQTPKDKSVFARIEVKTDPTQPNPGIFSRAMKTAIGRENTRIVVKKDEPQVQFESDSDVDEESLLEDSGNTATVTNLPHGMTDTRLKTLAGNDVQSLILDREERTAKITFKSTNAAETFKKKFNNKMVAASRLSVTLR